MKNRTDLVGKTISGVIAVPVDEEGPLKIWMLQFTDGTHVEFVSPGAQRTLERITKSGKYSRHQGVGSPQLALNVA